jgi:hypothetical protein
LLLITNTMGLQDSSLLLADGMYRLTLREGRVL